MCHSRKTPWLCAFGLTFVLLVMSTRCPYTHQNCVCKNTSVTCSNLQTIPLLNRGPDVIVVDTLQFLQGQIANVPENSLPPDLASLVFRDNPLTNISYDAFNNSSTTLKSLTIRNATFSQIPYAFSKLMNLQTLSLSSINITDWNSSVLQSISGTLQNLFFSAVNLSEWPRWISDCHSLNNFYINVATMTTIPDDALISMNKTLMFFSARHTGLTQIPKALSPLENLTTLEITGTRLANVNGREGFEQVTTFPWAKTLFTLRGTVLYIKSLPDLSALTRLTYLDLYLNEIPKVTSEMLPRGLVTLYLSYNRITKITDRSFINISRLELLSLESNPITEISHNAFKDLVSLKTLNLYYTRLTQIPLSLLLLSNLNSLGIYGVRTLQCPCPIVETQLQVWYASYNNTLELTGICCSQEKITTYLNGTCQQQLPAGHTCPSGSGPLLTPGVCSNCLLLLYLHVIVVLYLNNLTD